MGLGLQSAFGGQAVDDALQRMVAERRLRELQDQEAARQNADLAIRKQQVANQTQEAGDTHAAKTADYAIRLGELKASQPAAGPGEGGSTLSGPIPQGVPVSQPTLPGFKGIPQASIQSTGQQPTMNPWDHPTADVPAAFGQPASTIRLRTADENSRAQLAAELAKPVVLKKDEVLSSGGHTVATGPSGGMKLDAPVPVTITQNGKSREGMAAFDSEHNRWFEPGNDAPIQGTVQRSAAPRDPLVEELTRERIDALKNAKNVDPNAVAFWGQQVLKDPANMGLVKNKAMQEAVGKWIADNGGNVDRLTAADKQMRELATQVLPHVDTIRDEATQLEQQGLLGPIASRWRDFVAGTIGAGELAGGSKENATLIGKFQTDVGLLATAVGRVHGGARGGGSPVMLEHLKNLINAGSSDLPTFQGHLDSFHDWLTGYAGMTGTGAGPQTTGTVSVGRDANGNLVIKRE